MAQSQKVGPTLMRCKKAGPAFIVFIGVFAFLVSALAPTVTFEDSGELITAASNLGVAHEPGYPLFTLLGHVFTWLPWGDVAYRMNLFSAFCSAAGCAFVALICFDVLGLLFGEASFPLLRPVTSACFALILAASPEVLSQSTITEVYGLNLLLTSALIWVLLSWYRKRGSKRAELWAYAYCGLAGLSAANHHTSLAFVPLAFAAVFWIDRPFLLRSRVLLRGAAAYLAGLAPYLYLPIAAARHPALNWGDPETWSRFWQVVGRHQYGLSGLSLRAPSVVLAQIGVELELLREQFWIPLLLLAALGLYALYRRDRGLFKIACVWLLFTGPLVAYLTDVDVAVTSRIGAAEERNIVGVFFLPFYAACVTLMAGGFLEAVVWAKSRVRKRGVALVAGIALAASASAFAVSSRARYGMQGYRFTEQFMANLMQISEPHSLVLSNWDPFIFPAIYYQQVEKRAPGVIFVDVELARRSWYIAQLRQWYPEFMTKIERQTDAFLAAVRPFEQGEPYDGAFIQARYLELVNAMIDTAAAEMPVYATFYPKIRPLEQGIAAGYYFEPSVVAYRLSKDPRPHLDASLAKFSFSGFNDPAGPPGAQGDEMAAMIRDYYVTLLRQRAAFLATDPQTRSLAAPLYERAVELKGR